MSETDEKQIVNGEKEKHEPLLVNGQDPLDPDFPLWISFKNAAMGSSQHCSEVAGLTEAAALAIGLSHARRNILAIAARFHDVGKIRFPDGFIENQPGQNIHDQLPPEVSYQLIIAHIAHTIEVMVQAGFPPEVIGIASSHHGTSIITPFFKKAQGQKGAEEVREDSFRYPTAKPTTLEAMILMLCDQVQAEAKYQYSKKDDDKKPKSPEEIVQDRWQRMEDDCQFDEVILGPLAYGVLKQVFQNMKQAIAKEVASRFQEKRTEYPENKDDGATTRAGRTTIKKT